ncbi:MAG: nitrogen regulation protein NR(II) [Proteobacteria bacterium]|nr:nitrogen regulation protein NR(II) [Pseudomonadota bacterium]
MSPEAQASLLDALSTALAIIGPRGEIEYLNASAQTLIAVGINQARGRHLFEFLRDAEPIEAVVARARDGGEPIAYRELRLVPSARADSQFVVDCTASMLDAERVLLEISDTTRQQRISRDNALLAQLGGNRMMVRQLAHEIKNPLGGLRGAAQLLERELPAEPLKEYTRLIIREADRLRTLVDNLLGPGGVPHKTDVNPHEMLQHVFQLLRNEAPAGVQIVRDYDPSLPTVHVDRDQMIQAMLNLGRNAVQALEGQGRLTLRTRAVVNATIGARRHRVVASIQFEDDGPGVPPDLADTIFYPLVTGRADGTGLGLAVAQDLVTRHGGLIEFDSRRGHTVFTLLLPFDGVSNG